MLDLLQDETIKCVEEDQASISLIYSSNYSHTPGVFYNIARHLFWKNINVLTWLHTLTELTLIIDENDVTNCYDVLQKMLKEHKNNHDAKKKIQLA
jgi:aspartokinase